MPVQPGRTYPDVRHVVDHLAHYEKLYDLPVHRGARVEAVHRDGAFPRVATDSGDRQARAVVSATGPDPAPLQRAERTEGPVTSAVPGPRPAGHQLRGRPSAGGPGLVETSEPPPEPRLDPHRGHAVFTAPASSAPMAASTDGSTR